MTDFGDCVMTTLHDEQGQCAGIRVDQADPRIRIAAQFLGQVHDEIRFGELRCIGGDNGCPVGDVLVIDGVNRRVVYVVTGADEPWRPEPYAYVAEWPD